VVSTIVVGVDGSPSAGNAAHTAASLAQALGAELHVVSAYGKYEAETITSGAETFVISTEKAGEETVNDVARDLRRDFPDLTVHTLASQGKPGQALVSAAERLNADLIVVGNKRVQGITRVLGSVARDVAAHATCDVYVANTHPRG